MTLKKLLTLGLAGTLLVGTIATSSAAELDFEWYAKQNPDVVAVVGDSPEALKLHYEMYGRKEARMANTKDVEAQLRRMFNVEEYAKLYPDVKEFYGEDVEAMFMHYISYGLLEARRPSEKVSQAVANSLKKAVEKAMTDAGVEATPGSAELVAVITGEKAALTEAKPELALDTAKLEEVTKALEQVAAVVEKAVTETVKEVNDPTPPASSGGGGGGGGSDDGNADKGGDQGSVKEQDVWTLSGNLYASKSASGPFELIESGKEATYFSVSTNNRGQADQGYAIYTVAEQYELADGNTTNTGVDNYVAVTAGVTVSGTDGLKPYYLEAKELTNGDIEDYFTVAEDTGMITAAPKKTIFDSTGTKIENTAGSYVRLKSGENYTISYVNEGSTQVYVSGNDGNTTEGAEAIPQDKLGTYFVATGSTIKAAADLGEGVVLYKDAAGTEEITAEDDAPTGVLQVKYNFEINSENNTVYEPKEITAANKKAEVYVKQSDSDAAKLALVTSSPSTAREKVFYANANGVTSGTYTLLNNTPTELSKVFALDEGSKTMRRKNNSTFIYAKVGDGKYVQIKDDELTTRFKIEGAVAKLIKNDTVYTLTATEVVAEDANAGDLAKVEKK